MDYNYQNRFFFPCENGSALMEIFVCLRVDPVLEGTRCAENMKSHLNVIPAVNLPSPIRPLKRSCDRDWALLYQNISEDIVFFLVCSECFMNYMHFHDAMLR